MDGLDFSTLAKNMPHDVKKQFLLDSPETDLHEYLKLMLSRLDENYCVEITHGRDEHGRDLVVRQKDPMGSQYIGVIVKKGDKKGELTGKTSGVIDEVLSQARQAISHPCFVRELAGGAVILNQLWIIFVGRFTSTASERIEHELKGISNRIFSIEDVIDLFSQNYPEVFFNADLAEFAKNTVIKLEKQLNPDMSHKEYVSPWVRKWEKAVDISEELTNFLYSPKMPFQKLNELIHSGKRIILTGDPGIGKTTAITKIASAMVTDNFLMKSQNLKQETLSIPLLIKAKDFVEKSPQETYETYISFPDNARGITVSTLMIDGLDEISPTDRETCITLATEFADKYHCGIVITCRIVSTIMKVVSPFDRYELLPFDYNQAMSMVEQAIDDQKLLDTLRDGILSDEFKINFTPLALGMLIEVASYEKEVPASLVEIFERYTDVTCGKFDKSRGISSIFEHHVKKRFLSELAWVEFYSKRRFEIPVEEYSDFVRKYSHTYRWNEDQYEQFVDEIERSGIIKIDYKVSFWHRSFLDFFIAFRISEKHTQYPNLSKSISDLYFDERWSDVAFYYIGIQRELSPEILEGISEHTVKEFDDKVLMALIGRLLQAGWHTPSDLKITAIKQGLSVIDSIKTDVDTMLLPEKTKLPTIFSDCFYLMLSEYSFGSRTMLAETQIIVEECLPRCDPEQIRNVLLLMFAQRSRLTNEEKCPIMKAILQHLSDMENRGLLSVRQKFVDLLILNQIKTDNKPLMKSITRKMKRTKQLYPEEMRRLLPPPKTRMAFSIGKKGKSSP